jgi:hypothetical protein
MKCGTDIKNGSCPNCSPAGFCVKCGSPVGDTGPCLHCNAPRYERAGGSAKVTAERSRARLAIGIAALVLIAGGAGYWCVDNWHSAYVDITVYSTYGETVTVTVYVDDNIVFSTDLESGRSAKMRHSYVYRYDISDSDKVITAWADFVKKGTNEMLGTSYNTSATFVVSDGYHYSFTFYV